MKKSDREYASWSDFRRWLWVKQGTPQEKAEFLGNYVASALEHYRERIEAGGQDASEMCHDIERLKAALKRVEAGSRVEAEELLALLWDEFSTVIPKEFQD